jgi:small conductance mechanosensitive channel
MPDGDVSGRLVRLAIEPGGARDRLPAIAWDEVVDRVVDALVGALSSLGGAAVIVVLALLALRLLRMAVEKIVERVLARQDPPPVALQKQAQTLASVVESAGRLVVGIIAGLMVLATLGVDIGPLLASAGIAGLAIGLGAQTLIRDVISGFFIIFENQYSIGDVVAINAFSGTVEEVGLRRTVLRSIDGAMIIIPNGDIRSVENQSRGWSQAVVDVETTLDVDDTHVVAILHELLDDVQADPVIGRSILEPPEVLGVTTVSATAVSFRVVVRTKPGQQEPVERALRLRIRQAFREREIPMPGLTAPAAAEVER